MEGALPRVRSSMLAVVRAAAEDLPAVLAFVALLQNQDGGPLPCQDLATAGWLHHPPAQALALPRNHPGVQLEQLWLVLLRDFFLFALFLFLTAHPLTW